MTQDVAWDDNQRILIVDDNPAIHSDIKQILQDDDTSEFDEAAAILFGEPETTAVVMGYEIDSAYQGEEGLEKVIAGRASAASLRHGLCGYAHAARVGRASDHRTAMAGGAGAPSGYLHRLFRLLLVGTCGAFWGRPIVC